MDTLAAPVSTEGLPLFDRLRLMLVAWLLGGLSAPAMIRWRWTIIRERQP